MKQNWIFVFEKSYYFEKNVTALFHDLVRCDLQFLQVSGKISAATFKKILKHVPAFGCRGVYQHLNDLTRLSKINSPYTLKAILS